MAAGSVCVCVCVCWPTAICSLLSVNRLSVYYLSSVTACFFKDDEDALSPFSAPLDDTLLCPSSLLWSSSTSCL